MGLMLEWTNECEERTWYRSSMYFDGIAEGKMSTMPLNELEPGSGYTSMEMLVAGQDLLNKGIEYCTWQSPVDVDEPSGNYFWFSIQLQQPFNLFHVGWSASWQLATGIGPKQPPQGNNNVIPKASWRTVVSNPATPYILNNTTDHCPDDVKIELTPTAGGENLSVSVVMSDN